MNEIVSFTKNIEFKTLISDVTSISLEHTLMSYEDETIKGDLIVRGTYKQMVASQIDNPFNYKIPVDIVIDSKYDTSDMTIDIDNFTYEVEKGNILKLNIDLILDKLKLKEVKEEKKEENELDDELINIDDLFKEEETKEKLELEPLSEMRKKLDKEDEEEKSDSEEEKEVEEAKIDEDIDERKVKNFEEEKEEKEKNVEKRVELQEMKKEETIKPQETKKEKEESLMLERQLEINESKEKDIAIEKNMETNTTTPEEENKSDASESLFAKLDTTLETYRSYSIYIVREDDSLDEIMKKYNVKKENLEEYNNLSEVKKGTKLIIPCNNE